MLACNQTLTLTALVWLCQSKIELGSVLKSELRQKWRYGAGIHRLKVVLSESLKG